MTNAFRGHYEPATQQILPDADPYIAALVLEANVAPNTTAEAPRYDGFVVRAYSPIYHGPAYHGSTDPGARFVGEASPPLVADPATRIDRRHSPGRSLELSHRSRRIRVAARA